MKTTKPAMPKVPLGPVLRRYFCEYLVSQRDLSPQTIGSYRDTFRLLLAFVERRYRIKPDVVCVDDLDAPRVLAFLDDLERRRNNTARTRNARRAAIRSFLRYAAGVNPLLLPVAQRVLAIPAKRFERATVGYLTREQIQAIIDSPNTAIVHLFDPAKFVQLLESLDDTAFAQGLCRFLVIALLAKDFRDLGHFQACHILQELQRLAGRDATMLAAIADQDNPGAHVLGHVEHRIHVPRAKLAGLIDEDYSIFCRLLHLLVLQEPGHGVGSGEIRLGAKHFPAGLDGLGQSDHGHVRPRPKPRRFPVRGSFSPFQRRPG